MPSRPAINKSNEEAGPVLPLVGSDGHVRELQDIRREVVLHAITRHGGSVTKAARALGVGRSTLYRMLHHALQDASPE